MCTHYELDYVQGKPFHTHSHTHTQGSHSPRLIIPDSLNAQSDVVLSMSPRSVALTFCCFLENTVLSLDGDRDGRRRRSRETCFKKMLHLQDFMESCFQSQRVVSICFSFPFNLVILLISICKHNKNRISHPGSLMMPVHVSTCASVFVLFFCFFRFRVFFLSVM